MHMITLKVLKGGQRCLHRDNSGRGVCSHMCKGDVNWGKQAVGNAICLVLKKYLTSKSCSLTW